MDISIFTETKFDDANALADFFMANARCHAAVADYIGTQFGISIPLVPSEQGYSTNDWLQVHQNIHQMEFDSIGLTNQGQVMPDLTYLDPKDESTWHSWMQNHSNVHLIVNQIARLT
jgi:hypothetical protein